MKPHNARPGSIRFPVAMQLKYKAASPEVAVSGVGRTSMMSSTELIFTAEQPVEPGMKAEVSVAWPALLEGRVRLQLIIEGTILRTEGPEAVVKISKYRYKTRGAWGDGEPTEAGRVNLPPLHATQPPATASLAAHGF